MFLLSELLIDLCVSFIVFMLCTPAILCFSNFYRHSLLHSGTKKENMAACRSRLSIGRRILENSHFQEKSIARMFCTNAKKRRIMSREKRVEAVKTFVQQYMLQFPGKFPSGVLVKKEVGGCSEVLKPIIEELKITLKTSQDQKGSADVNEGALEAVESIASENLSIFEKSNDDTVKQSNSLNQNDLLSFNKTLEIGIPNNKMETLFQASEKEFVVEKDTYIGASLYDKQERTSFHSSIEKGEPVIISSMSENIDLPDNQEKTSLQSSNEKEELISATGLNLLPLSFPKITSEKADRNTNNEDYSSVIRSKELSSTSIELKNPELNKLREGFPIKASTVLEEMKFEKNENKEVNSSTIASNIRKLFATNLKVVPEKNTKVPSLDSQDVIQYAKIDNKEIERGSSVPNNFSLLGRSATKVDTNTQIRKQQLMKQVDQDQRNRRFPSTYALQSHKTSDEETEDDSDFAAFDYPEPDGSNQPVIARTNFRLDKAELSEKPKSQPSLLVKFLPLSATEHDLCMAFGDCGSITQVHIIRSSREESRFNYASIIFKTQEGFRKALLKKDVVVSGGDVVLEAISSYNQNLYRDFTPKTVKNIGVPITEIKHPSCTIMIKHLPHGLSFEQLKNALAFCGTVSNISMGSMNSAIYIEFKREEAKERALMAHWISIDGHQLQIRRVDAPRTPVVRISNVSLETGDEKLLNICQSFGRVKRLERRHKDTVDVHFYQTEMGSMINILDSLNGVVMNQCRWQAQPAPVFPPETVHGLWSSADGRNYLRSVIQNLFRIINRSYINDNDFNELVAQYYREAVSRTEKL